MISGQARLIFLVDTDDPTLLDYPGTVIAGEPTGDPVGPLNREVARSTADIVGFVGDDSRCLTKGWDVQVQTALIEPGFCWGDDGHDKPWPSTAFISRSITEALGHAVLPGFRRGFFDVYWVYLAAESGTGHEIRAQFPHDNSKSGKVAQEILDADEQVLQHWRAGDIRGEAQKIRNVVDLAHFFPR